MPTRTASPRLGGIVTDVLGTARPSLLFGIRLWVSVCLALYVAFWLQLDDPFWAGATAAIVCQPRLGASMRKGWFRMIGTVIGATAIVLITASFPQNRMAFLGLLALWSGLCALAATLLRNFASYSAALAGYTAAIIAADALGPTGGPSSDIFMLSITRTSEICIGIVCAGIVLTATDLGEARHRLAALLAELIAQITAHLVGILTGPRLPDKQLGRRELIRRAIALDPALDEALGESSDLRYRLPTLRAAVRGLFGALDGCRGVANHLKRLSYDVDRPEIETILRCIPPKLLEPRAPDRWIPFALHGECETATRMLLTLPVVTPSQRLLADESAKVLAGLSRALAGLSLLVGGNVPPQPGHGAVGLSVPDWLPAALNAARATVIVGAVALFWIATGWPNGASAIVFAAVVVLLLSPRGDIAYAGAFAFAIGVAIDVPCAAFMKFAVLPALQTFPAFCLAIGFFFVPIGFAVARSRHPTVTAVFAAMASIFLSLLAPTNQMSYDTTQFYNSSLAIAVGCCVALLAFCLMPPLSPAVRARRLLDLTLRDLHRLGATPDVSRLEDWENRLYGRLAVLPDQAVPLDRARLLAALSVGIEITHLRRMAPGLGANADLEAAFTAFVQSNCGIAVARLRRLDEKLAIGPTTTAVLRARGHILVLAEALGAHGAYFDMAVPA
jgi:uncharacterized membrane protein YccC